MVTESSLLISLCSESFISIIIINHHFYKYGHDSFFCSTCDIITWCHRGEAEPSVFSLFVCTFIHLYRLFSHQPRRLRSSSSVSSWASSSSQLVPKFDKRFSVLPDQLVTEHDVPAGGEGNREHDGRWCQKHVSLLEEEIRLKKNHKNRFKLQLKHWEQLQDAFRSAWRLLWPPEELQPADCLSGCCDWSSQWLTLRTRLLLNEQRGRKTSIPTPDRPYPWRWCPSEPGGEQRRSWWIRQLEGFSFTLIQARQ